MMQLIDAGQPTVKGTKRAVLIETENSVLPLTVVNVQKNTSICGKGTTRVNNI